MTIKINSNTNSIEVNDVAVAIPTGGGSIITTNDTGTVSTTMLADSNVTAAKMAAGAVVQFKHEAFNSAFSTSSSTYQDAYSFTFTPTKATNKVLLQFTARMYQTTASRENRIKFLRDSTLIHETRGNWNTGGAIAFNGIYEVVDIPGTTDEVTYKLQCRNETNASGTIHFLYATDGAGYYNGPPMLRAWEITV